MPLLYVPSIWLLPALPVSRRGRAGSGLLLFNLEPMPLLLYMDFRRLIRSTFRAKAV